MPSSYFSDREQGQPAQILQDVEISAWRGLVALIHGLITNGAFGIDFPDECMDGNAIIGTNEYMLGLAIQGEIPNIGWPLLGDSVPSTMDVMDLLEFCYAHVAEANSRSYHNFMSHHHLSFDRNEGQEQFCNRVNLIMSRNRLAYELNSDGTVSRVAAPVLQEALSSQYFDSGDDILDQLLESARTKFLDPDSAVRREALEKLWDAWERVKTLEEGKKRASTKALLDKAASEAGFRKLIEDEARALTDVGNKFHIRHSETDQVEIQSENQVDYLFHRLFALIWLVLSAR